LVAARLDGLHLEEDLALERIEDPYPPPRFSIEENLDPNLLGAGVELDDDLRPAERDLIVLVLRSCRSRQERGGGRHR
jgi:hypothetical protein